MKQATEAFVIDNGTVAAGQVLPDSHPAVAAEPAKFDDVPDPDPAYGQVITGTGEVLTPGAPDDDAPGAHSADATPTPAAPKPAAPADATPTPAAPKPAAPAAT